MQFLKEIRDHLSNFETEAKDEIHKFIDWLHTKYVEPCAPVVSLPATNYVEPAATFTQAVEPAAETVEPVAVPVETPVEAPPEAPVDAPVEPIAVPVEAPAAE